MAQQVDRPLPEEARKRLDHSIGEWTFVTKVFNRNGEVIREIEGRDKNRFVIADRVVEHINRTGDATSRGLMFYNFREKRFQMTSVDKSGDLWILSGGLDKYILTSRARKRPNGSESMIRFVHENIQADSFEAKMEISFDGGETWRLRSRQFLKRVKPNRENTKKRANAVDPRVRPTVTTLAIRVHHMDKMTAFYREAFGFKFREVNTQGIQSQFGTNGRLTLKLVPLRDAADFEGYPSHQPGIAVQNVEAVIALARKYGGRQEGDLLRKDGKVVGAAVRDPDGNTVELYLRKQ